MRRIVFILTLAIIAACSPSKDKKTELADLKKQRAELDAKIAQLEAEVGTKDSTASKTVSVLPLKTDVFTNYLEIQGKVDAEQNVSVNPEMQGIVTAVYVSIGQTVRQGQVLAQIDDNILRQNMAQLQTQLDLATNLYNRQKNLWDQKIGTEVQFLNAKTQKEGLERQMNVLTTQQAMYKIKAPISGSVEQMDLKVGGAAMPGMNAIRIVNASSLKAKALVAESYLGKVGQGDEVNVIFPDLKDSIKTKVSFASKVIDPASRSFNVEVKLPSNAKYRANMIAILKVVDYRNNSAITIPVNTIQRTESGAYVWIAENGKAKRAAITMGRTFDGKTEITSGLKAGDQLIVTGGDNLNEGDSLKF